MPFPLPREALLLVDDALNARTGALGTSLLSTSSAASGTGGRPFGVSAGVEDRAASTGLVSVWEGDTAGGAPGFGSSAGAGTGSSVGAGAGVSADAGAEEGVGVGVGSGTGAAAASAGFSLVEGSFTASSLGLGSSLAGSSFLSGSPAGVGSSAFTSTGSGTAEGGFDAGEGVGATSSGFGVDSLPDSAFSSTAGAGASVAGVDTSATGGFISAGGSAGGGTPASTIEGEGGASEIAYQYVACELKRDRLLDSTTVSVGEGDGESTGVGVGLTGASGGTLISTAFSVPSELEATAEGTTESPTLDAGLSVGGREGISGRAAGSTRGSGLIVEGAFGTAIGTSSLGPTVLLE